MPPLPTLLARLSLLPRGGAGDDSLAGHAEAALRGGAGNDTLAGGRELWGEAGQDSLVAGNVAALLVGGAGDDTLRGAAGADTLLGGAGWDLLLGGAGADLLHGGAGGDSLDGGEGHDTLLGGAGADTLSGGAGNDRLIGGEGADTFLFAAGFGFDTMRGDPLDTLVVEFAASRVEMANRPGGDLLMQGFDAAGVEIERLLILGGATFSLISLAIPNGATMTGGPLIAGTLKLITAGPLGGGGTLTPAPIGGGPGGGGTLTLGGAGDLILT